MDIKAFKMDGLGNDFVIIDQRIKNIEFSKEQIIKICDRNFIGCDQLIIIKKNRELDAGLEFYNSDGSGSGACGNGTRCVAYLLSKENNNKEILLRPELRIFNQPITITSEADIKTNFIGDKFLVMNLVKGNEYYNIRYQTKPFMIWIWLSAILMGSGALTNFFKRR